MTQIKLGRRKFEDVEAESYENCVFKYRGQDIELKCKILTIEIEKATPGLIDSKINKFNNIKRVTHSDYNINESVNPNKKTSLKINEVTSIDSTIEISSSSSSALTSTSSTQASYRSTVDAYSEMNDLAPELDLKDFTKLADQKKFPKKEFMIKNKIKNFTPMLHFFKTIRVFIKHPEVNERLNYECKICNENFVSPFTDKSDLYKHLNRHDDYKKWNEKYCYSKGNRSGPVIDDSMLLLIKYFVTSNASHSSLENQYLRILLNKVVGTKSFDDNILPEIYKKLRLKLKYKLDNAEDICLMSDIWTAKQNSDFIALVTALMNENFKREVLVIDMMRMP